MKGETRKYGYQMREDVVIFVLTPDYFRCGGQFEIPYMPRIFVLYDRDPVAQSFRLSVRHAQMFHHVKTWALVFVTAKQDMWNGSVASFCQRAVLYRIQVLQHIAMH